MPLEDQTHSHLSAHHGDFSNFADLMVKTHQGRFDSVFWGFLDQYRPQTVDRVVDLGTGPGLLLPELKVRFPNAHVTGVDAQPEMLKYARAREGDGVNVIEHDLSTPNIPGIADASVDLAVAAVLLHEMQVPTVLLDEVARILRPGGVFIVLDWVRQPLSSYVDDERQNTLDKFTHFSEHCRYAPEDLAWLFEQSGFSVPEWIARRKAKFVLMAAMRDPGAPS